MTKILAFLGLLQLTYITHFFSLTHKLITGIKQKNRKERKVHYFSHVGNSVQWSLLRFKIYKILACNYSINTYTNKAFALYRNAVKAGIYK